jgi:hypothetical protein
MNSIVKRYIRIFVGIFALVVFDSCYYDKSEELYGKGSCDTTTVAYASNIAPIINRDCAGCHSGGSPSAGISLYDYTTVKNYMTSNRSVLMGSVKQDGTASNMPKGGSKISACEINKLEAWVNQGMKP